MSSACFNSRASCEARRGSSTPFATGSSFNSRASCEARRMGLSPSIAPCSFNSRASCEARQNGEPVYWSRKVSIHAPLARRDLGASKRAPAKPEFQFTRLLRGATRVRRFHRPPARFQFTRLLRGATAKRAASRANGAFQFTRLLRGATSTPTRCAAVPAGFNSRASCEARRGSRGTLSTGRVSIHAPLARRDAQGALV